MSKKPEMLSRHPCAEVRAGLQMLLERVHCVTEGRPATMTTGNSMQPISAGLYKAIVIL